MLCARAVFCFHLLMTGIIKLSAPELHGFWEIEVLYEDAELLALDKPAGLLLVPDPNEPEAPALMPLLHRGIADGKPWATTRGLGFLSNVHVIDREASGVLLLARSKSILGTISNLIGSEQPVHTCLALVRGEPPEDEFEINAPIGQDAVRPGLLRVDTRHGKRSRTLVRVAKRFAGFTLVRCQPLTGRPHQIRVHLRYARFPVAGDLVYGGRPFLLSQLKPVYRLKPGKVEKPLLDSAAVHSESIEIPHPNTGVALQIKAPLPKHLSVALKYLERYRNPSAPPPPE